MSSMKSNLRSFRYSDEVASVLENFGSGSLNDNFERLVLYCNMKLPEIHQQVEALELLRDSLRDECELLIRNHMQALVDANSGLHQYELRIKDIRNTYYDMQRR